MVIRSGVKSIFLCAINNLRSGSCSEDCKFCTQSIRYKAKIQRYRFKNESSVIKEAQVAQKNGALGYCLVTDGKGLDDITTEYIAKLARVLKQKLPQLHLIACNGTATAEQLRYLKANGISSYNHNLETSKEYYPSICTTHSWEERYKSCEAVKMEGLALCSGGIFGMGESRDDQKSLLKALYSLKPESIPLNFYIPNPALPITQRTINQKEALDIIKETKKLFDKLPLLMVAGGREALFKGKEKLMFEAGANAIVIGNYLTTKGQTPYSDRQMLKSLGYKIAMSCYDT